MRGTFLGLTSGSTENIDATNTHRIFTVEMGPTADPIVGGDAGNDAVDAEVEEGAIVCSDAKLLPYVVDAVHVALVNAREKKFEVEINVMTG
jgi:hypothetical protein